MAAPPPRGGSPRTRPTAKSPTGCGRAACARELDYAVRVNPFAVDDFADALHLALSMPPDEQARRMRGLREVVTSHTVFDWASTLLQAAVRVELVPR